MGLDAYVYRDRTRLPFAASFPGVSIDERTGLIDFDDPDMFRQFADKVVALHRRLGNVSLIAELKIEVHQIGSAELPIITNLVLGNGSHCGDLIEIAQLDALEQELDRLGAASTGRSECTDNFVLQMRELVAAARSENNPIYFG